MREPEELLRKYGPWALVTGAAQGIGAEFAEQIGAAGLNLVLVDIDEQCLRAHCDSLRERHPVEVRPVVLDLRREDLLDSLLPEIAGLEIGLLVNNAGIAKIGPFLPQERGFLLDQLHVNTRAVLLLTHAFGSEMKARGRGGPGRAGRWATAAPPCCHPWCPLIHRRPRAIQKLSPRETPGNRNRIRSGEQPHR